MWLRPVRVLRHAAAMDLPQIVHNNAQTLLLLAQHLRDRNSPLRQTLLHNLPETTGLHRASLQRLTDLWVQAWLPDAVKRLLLLGGDATQAWQPAGTVGLVAPTNLPVATWQPILQALLLGNRVRVRPGAGDRLSAQNLLQVLTMFAPELADRVEICAFDQQDTPQWQHFFKDLDALLIYGGDAAVAAVADRAANAGYNGAIRRHGHRQSLGILPVAALDGGLAEVASGLAHDALLADGRGCLSLRAVVLVGAVTGGDWRKFAQQLGIAVAGAAQKFPAGTIAPQWAAQTHLLRETLAFSAALSPDRIIFQDLGDAWLAAEQRLPLAETADLGPGARGLMLWHAPDLATLQHNLTPLTGKIAACAIADQTPQLLAMLSDLRVPRVCRAGELQAPPLDAPHDGYAAQEGLIRWQRQTI